jgi:hypothetical protein
VPDCLAHCDRNRRGIHLKGNPAGALDATTEAYSKLRRGRRAQAELSDTTNFECHYGFREYPVSSSVYESLTLPSCRHSDVLFTQRLIAGAYQITNVQV